MRKYRISTGTDFLSPEVKVKELSADEIVNRLKRFHVTDFKRDEYRTLSKRQRAAVKKESGFFIGGDGGGAKKRDAWKLSSLATLDLDALTPESAAASIDAVRALGSRAVIYSTASHCPEMPRLRVVFFLAADVVPGDYAHLIERIASRLPPGAVSDESYKVVQLMYFPQRCVDGEEYFCELLGEPLDPAPFLAEPRSEVVAYERSSRATPAWDKPGIVGAVARRYEGDLDAAIEELGIENVPYESSTVGPTCAIGEKRYTRVGATGADGALWYPDDGHLFSHHGASDPGAGMNQTIFDVVRLTHWKKLDESAPAHTPIHKLPSHKACADWFLERIPELGRRIETGTEFDDLDELDATPDADTDPKKESRFKPIPIGEFSGGAEPEWIVDSVLPRAELAVIFGESGCGKSFFALDMMLAIARGVPWHERETKQGKVAYVCGESPRGFTQRAKAYAHHHSVSLSTLGDAFCIVPCAPDLLKTHDVSEFIKQLLTLGQLAVVVIDTFARSTPGANENSGEDMGFALKHCQKIHVETGALVVLIHHSGKDAGRGARGWSGTRAAADTEIEVNRLFGRLRCATVTKQRDGEDKIHFGFELASQTFGYASNGDEQSSLVVIPRASYEKQSIKAPTSPKQLAVWQVLHAAGGTLGYNELLERVATHLNRIPGKPDRRKQYAREALDALITVNKLVSTLGIVTFAGVATAGEWDAKVDTLGLSPRPENDCKKAAAQSPTTTVRSLDPDPDRLPPTPQQNRRRAKLANKPAESVAARVISGRSELAASGVCDAAVSSELEIGGNPVPAGEHVLSDATDLSWLDEAEPVVTEPPKVEDLRAKFMECLDVNADVADLLLQHGYVSIEEIAEGPSSRMSEIQDFDENIVGELMGRARTVVIEMRC